MNYNSSLKKIQLMFSSKKLLKTHQKRGTQILTLRIGLELKKTTFLLKLEIKVK